MCSTEVKVLISIQQYQDSSINVLKWSSTILQVSWSRNGKVVSGASLSRYFPDEDGTFHQLSSLDFIPYEGDEYSCSVTHPALDRPTVRFWGQYTSADFSFLLVVFSFD